ncbi:hypothetical protein ABZW11_11890 [Nonomuraea sp. NPDC004580]
MKAQIEQLELLATINLPATERPATDRPATDRSTIAQSADR